MRVGIGYDIHRTKEGDHIYLGSRKIAAPFSLEGHSDADVLLHALTDAVLGALSDFDIGHYFPPSKEENKNRASRDFILFAAERMRMRGYKIENIDCNIICEAPKIAPVREEIRLALAKLLGITVDAISVKGRTNEKMGAIGEGKAIACQAIVLLG
ncbi:MAG: 2-C-methyl-D-erythritol 2,4-cyclodiphosphate synthase [Turneriella sp.]|nr:2-C-methyl-D-erythritol 2,4-cyclodiphosphate synthase [Turneriella sp.]